MIHSMMQPGNDGPGSYQPNPDGNVNLLFIAAGVPAGETFWMIRHKSDTDTTLSPTTASAGIALDLSASPTPDLVEIAIEFFEGDQPQALYYAKNNGSATIYTSGFTITTGDLLRVGMQPPIGGSSSGSLTITVTPSGVAQQVVYYTQFYFG